MNLVMNNSEPVGFKAVVLVSATYHQSQDLGLCVRRLRHVLGKQAIWCADLATWRAEALAQAASGLPLLLISEPGFLGVPGWASALLAALSARPDLDVVLPADPTQGGFSSPPAYYTLRGFESYAASASLVEPGISMASAYVALARPAVVAELLGTDPTVPFSHNLALGQRVAAVLGACVHPFFRYFDLSREDMLPLVPLEARRVLDVGCAHGAFGALLKQRLGCAVDGVEAVEVVAAQAEQRLDQVYRGDFLQATFPQRYDLISFLDVLEHFPNPVAVLDKARSLLAPGGKLLLSVPNVGFWAVVDDLLAGRWDYVPAGILCETHLRFFTAKTLADLLDECGFSIVRQLPLQVPMPEAVAARLAAVGNVDSLTTCSFSVLAKLRD